MPNILIVDDSTFARNSIHRILKPCDCEIREAASGKLALEMVKQQAPDLATLDLLMPEMSGLETMLAIREISPKTHFIIISADIQKTTQDELISAGAEAFINKPVSQAELLATVTRLLDLN